MNDTLSNTTLDSELKEQVHDFWNDQACGTHLTDEEKFSREYFDEIERERYALQPEIFSFAQFTRFYGKKVLEVGVGAATDFLQWRRAGAEAYGVDLTEEAVSHARRRFAVYGLDEPDVRVADCERLPFSDNSFDVVYSFGVIHHTPNTERALAEIVRVCKPGGVCKVMIYHRHSVLAFFFWVKHALLKGRPWKSFAWCLANFMESAGTKAYTKSETLRILSDLPVSDVSVRSVATYYDRLERFGAVARGVAKALLWLLGGDRAGWFLLIECAKVTKNR